MVRETERAAESREQSWVDFTSLQGVFTAPECSCDLAEGSAVRQGYS